MRRDEIVSGKAIRCYDNGGKTADRYTVIYMKERQRDATYAARGMSENPSHPQGVGQFTSATPGSHLGQRVKFDALPEACRRVVTADLGVSEQNAA